ncbi:MAG: PAS domain-containing protein, partial [Promethearchaeota archaeon]
MTDQDQNDILRKKTIPQLKGYVENLEQLVEERTKALKESEAKQQAILSAIGDLITIQNKDLDIIWINQQERAIYGDVIGKKCYKAYKGLDAPCPNCTVEKVFKEEKTVISEGMIIRPDGRPIHILTTSSPVRDAEGNIIAVVEMVKDITERKQLERQLKAYTENLEKIVDERTKALKESEARLQSFLTAIGDYITIQNKNLDVIWINQPIRDN